MCVVGMVYSWKQSYSRKKMYITEIDIEITDGDVFSLNSIRMDFDIVVNKTEG